MVQFLGSNYVKKADRNVEGKPQTLYKRAGLRLDPRTNEIRIRPLFGHEQGLGVNTDATCNAGSSHQSPHRLCRCGFYAYSSYDDAKNHSQGGAIIIKVVGSGKMFQYSKGYRYEHQRLEQVEVSKCTWCSSSAYRFAIAIGEGSLLPICRGHAAKTSMKTLRFSAFEDLASAELPSNAPRITVKAETYETLPNNLKHFVTSPRALKAAGIGLSALVGFKALSEWR